MAPSSASAALTAEILRLLNTDEAGVPPAEVEVARRTHTVVMRDGARLATEVFLPRQIPAPTMVIRTPYGRTSPRETTTGRKLAQAGWVVVSQDCRGTGDSEPDEWDYYVFEQQDGFDCIDWVKDQPWCDGFIAACGGSYVGQTQWSMATHPAMSTIVPEVSGMGLAPNHAHLHMMINAYSRTVGKGAEKLKLHFTDLERAIHEETLATGYFNDPIAAPIPEALLARYPQLRTLPLFEARNALWAEYGRADGATRADIIREAMGSDQVTAFEIEFASAVFGPQAAHDAHSIPIADPRARCQALQAPPLMITGLYDWALNDALATWARLMREGRDDIRADSRLILTPAAHNIVGYQEGADAHPELRQAHRSPNHLGLLRLWCETLRQGQVPDWPRVIYYLMGANEWRTASRWPPAELAPRRLHLAAEGRLTPEPPTTAEGVDSYVYDPAAPTPTVGGSVVSVMYPPGSVDVSAVQARDDVLTYTTEILAEDLDVVGKLRLVLYASSSAVDTDFTARLSDVFPDGRVIQIQLGLLRARFRDLEQAPSLLTPGEVYRFEIDMWATANRFRAGHRLRLDIASSDFPRYDRNANLGGAEGEPEPATQQIFHGVTHPSHLEFGVLEGEGRS